MLDVHISSDLEEITFTTTCDRCGCTHTDGGLRSAERLDTDWLYIHETKLTAGGWKLTRKQELCAKCCGGKQ